MRSGESRYVGFFLGRGAAGVASYVHVCFVGVRLGRRVMLSLGKFRSGVFRYGRQGGVSFVVVRWYELG